MNSAREDARTHAEHGAEPQTGARQGGLLAAAGFFGAILASSCCVVPLLLAVLGISGAWMGTLTALAPYKVYFIVGTALLLGSGFWYAYFRPRTACAAGTYCANPASGRITKGALWLATAIVVLAATVDYWAAIFYQEGRS